VANFRDFVWFNFHNVLNWFDGFFDPFPVQTGWRLILFPETKI